MRISETKNKKAGFTLVEMMVAIAVFSIVMVVAMSALLNVIDANQKAQTIKTAINNVHFALESISKDMRVGTEYNCAQGYDTVPSGECRDGGETISYRSHTGDYVYYSYNDSVDPPRIERCLGGGPDESCSGIYSSITSTDVNIKAMKFYVIKTCTETKCQPRMILTLTGEAGAKDKTKTTFDLQTSVSQRIRQQ